MTNLEIHSDGGARGNPGPAGIGAVIETCGLNTEHQIVKEISKYIDVATNNQAEYKAVVEALKWVKENLTDKELVISCYLDSQLVVEQLKGNYQMKNEGLKPLFWEIRDLIMSLGGRVSFQHIPREQNKEADKLVNEAIDKALNIK